MCQSAIANTAYDCPRCGHALRSRVPAVSFARVSVALFAVGGSLACGVAGLMLLDIKAAGENSLLEGIAHGLGVYCLGRAGMALSNAFR